MSVPEPYFSDDMVTVHLGDCLDVLAGMEAESIDAVVTDPPYGLEFMGREWDAFKPSKARIRTRIDGRTNPAEGKSVTSTPESYTAGQPFQAWCEAWARECLRILKPGGHMLAFGGTRTWHRLACAIEDAGFEIRDSVADLTGIDGPGLLWMQGSGFPKSLDVSRAIDREAVARSLWDEIRAHLCHWRDARGLTNAELNEAVGGAVNGGGRASAWLSGSQRKPELPSKAQWDRLREVLRWDQTHLDDVYGAVKDGADRPVLEERSATRQGGTWADQENSGMFRRGDASYAVTSAATEAAARWEGWGTALKPAWEPVVVGRKPLASTVAQNVLQFGTGALNIDGCRVGSGGYDAPGDRGHENARSRQMDFGMAAGKAHDAGRWPPNVLLGEAAAAELDRQSGVTVSSGGKGAASMRTALGGAVYGDYGHGTLGQHAGGVGDTGGASRFFPVFKYEPKAGSAERPRLADGTAHVTVKPVDLIRWLVRLVTPPGGVVLDPFAGSGSTGEACIVEGFRSVLVERDPKYAELIMTRLRKPIQPDLFGSAS